MEEKKFIGMTPNVVFGLTWILFPFGIVALAVDHDKMTKNDKQQIVSAFVLDGITMILSIVISIIEGILIAATGTDIWNLFGLILIVPFVFWLIAMIQAFRGIEYHCPLAWSIAGAFVHDGPADKKEEVKAEEKPEATEEASKEEEKAE